MSDTDRLVEDIEDMRDSLTEIELDIGAAEDDIQFTQSEDRAREARSRIAGLESMRNKLNHAIQNKVRELRAARSREGK